VAQILSSVVLGFVGLCFTYRFEVTSNNQNTESAAKTGKESHEAANRTIVGNYVTTVISANPTQRAQYLVPRENLVTASFWGGFEIL
jgi:hypothetical protein